MLEEEKALTPQQERLCQEAYQNLKISEASTVGEEESYVFVSYKSQDYQTVYGDLVAPLQEKQGLRVYCDKAFAATNENWVNQIKKNMAYKCCPAVICLITKDYMQSYATLMEIMLSQVGQRMGNHLELFLVFLEPIPLDDGGEFRKFFNILERNDRDTGLPREGLERSTFNQLFIKMVEKLSAAPSYPHRNEDALQDLREFAAMERGESKAFTTVTCFTMMREIINYLNDQNNFFFFYDVLPQARNEFYNSFSQCIRAAVSDYHNVFVEVETKPVEAEVVAENVPEKVEEKVEVPEPTPVVSENVPEKVEEKAEEPEPIPVVAEKVEEKVEEPEPTPVVAENVPEKEEEKAEEPLALESTLLPPTPLSAFEIQEGTLTNLLDKTLTEVVIPDSVTEIGESAFKRTFLCRLTSVVIPDSVTVIGKNAFLSCDYLTSVVIPDSVTVIGDSAFKMCEDLPSVVIPPSVTKIGESLFNGCASLTSVVIPDFVTMIGSFAFKGCTSLTSMVIPDSVTEIGAVAFYECKALTSVVIGDSVTVIGQSGFESCTSLTSVVIPDSVTVIGQSGFESCTSLASVVIPDSVRKIGRNSFQGCESLQSVTVAKGSVAESYFMSYHELLTLNYL